MSRVLVTGAGGFVGRALVPALVAAGHDVVGGWRRPPENRIGAGGEVRVVGDIGPCTDWRRALEGIDAVVHLAARVHVIEDEGADALARYRRVNTAATVRLAEDAVARGVRRLVFLSTVKVLGQASGQRPFADGDAAAPTDPYAVSKWEAEEALARISAHTGLETVVLRPPLVYGPGVGGNFLALMRLCRRAPPLPLASVANRRSLLYVGNLADAVGRCLVAPAAAGRRFLVRDGEDVSTPGLIRRLAALLGRPARLLPAPPGLLRMAGRLAGRDRELARLLDTLAVDDGQLRRVLGWLPPFTLEAGLAATAAWFGGLDPDGDRRIGKP